MRAQLAANNIKPDLKSFSGAVVLEEDEGHTPTHLWTEEVDELKEKLSHLET